jgi:hypothetical protein
MARFDVRSGSLGSLAPIETAANGSIDRTGANGRERPLALAMQKVVGSSPIIRFEKSLASAGLFSFQVVVVGDRIAPGQVPGQVRVRSGSEATLGSAGEHGGVALGGATDVVGVDAHRHLRVGVTGQLRVGRGVEFQANDQVRRVRVPERVR